MNTSGKLRVEWPEGAKWDELLNLDARFFPHPWKADQWSSLNRSQHRLFVWVHGEKLIGFALFAYLDGDETAHLLKISLDPSFRGSGEALKFWNEIRLQLQDLKVFLEVEQSNSRARGFYTKVGFSVLRTIKGYYSNGEDAVVMLLTP